MSLQMSVPFRRSYIALHMEVLHGVGHAPGRKRVQQAARSMPCNNMGVGPTFSDEGGSRRGRGCTTPSHISHLISTTVSSCHVQASWSVDGAVTTCLGRVISHGNKTNSRPTDVGGRTKVDQQHPSDGDRRPQSKTPPSEAHISAAS